MPIVELGDICEFLDYRRKPVSEELRKSGPYPYYGANGQQGWIDSYIFDEPLVLLAEDGGHFGSATKSIAYKISGKTWVNNHAHVLRPGAECDIDYLTHALSFYDVSKLIGGTTRPKLTKGNAEVIKLPLPDLPEQKQIAGRLEQADRLRRTRRYALELSDTFLPAAFLELFGDPITNEKGWNVAPLGDACVDRNGIKAGPFGSSLKKDTYSSSGIRVYGQEQVIAGDFSVGDYYISERMFEDFAAYEVKPGDVLISLVGTFGRVVVVPGGIERGIINPRLLKISPKPSALDSTFLARLIEHPITQRELLRMSHGGTMGILNAGLLRELRIILPPLSTQQHFAALVARHERLDASQREALRQADHLFESLLYQSFTASI